MTRRDPPEGAEWRWKYKRLGIAVNDVRKVWMWSFRYGPFITVQDYRGAHQTGFYFAGRFFGFIRRCS